jgi:hypothetical protein
VSGFRRNGIFWENFISDIPHAAIIIKAREIYRNEGSGLSSKPKKIATSMVSGKASASKISRTTDQRWRDSACAVLNCVCA